MLDPATYPHPRPKRIGGGWAPSISGGPPLPRTRVLPFYFTMTANNRRAFTLPRCQGPAIIKRFAWETSGGAEPATATIELGYASVPFSEAGVAVTTSRPYTVITELTDPFGLIADLAGFGWPNRVTGAGSRASGMDTDFIIDLSEFYVVIATQNNGAGILNFDGHVTVIEGVSREALANFL